MLIFIRLEKGYFLALLETSVDTSVYVFVLTEFIDIIHICYKISFMLAKPKLFVFHIYKLFIHLLNFPSDPFSLNCVNNKPYSLSGQFWLANNFWLQNKALIFIAMWLSSHDDNEKLFSSFSRSWS